MVLFFPKEKHHNLVFLDTEFNNRKLIQVSMIVYEQIEVENVIAYLLKGSINVYIDNEINRFFTNYTGITRQFLEVHSVQEWEAVDLLNEFLKELRTEDTMYIAHGVKQDLDLLIEAGVDIGTAERYCTYNNAKTLLKREKDLRLTDVCNESGYYADQHDAYTDAKSVVHAFSYLKLVEATEG